MIEYAFRLLPIIVGILVGFLGPARSGRDTALIGLAGLFLVVFGVAMGLSSDFSMSRLLDMISLNPKLIVHFGRMEYVFILGGYAFLVCSICLAIREVGKKKGAR